METGSIYYYTLPENTSKKEIDEKGYSLTLSALDFHQGSDDRQFCDYIEKDVYMCAKLTTNYASANASNEAYKIHYSVLKAIMLEELDQNKYKYATVKYYYEVPTGKAPSAENIILRQYNSERSWLG
ncbi:MAG: hypothetical protein IJ391_05685 [Clostridia bacterium]|nr:hypothetical protein [Clostridia bacterium]